MRLKSKDETKYEEKLLAKATVIADSANRLWRTHMIPAYCSIAANACTEMEMMLQVYEE